MVPRTLRKWNSRLFPGFPGHIFLKFQVIFSRQSKFLLIPSHKYRAKINTKTYTFKVFFIFLKKWHFDRHESPLSPLSRYIDIKIPMKIIFAAQRTKFQVISRFSRFPRVHFKFQVISRYSRFSRNPGNHGNIWKD